MSTKLTRTMTMLAMAAGVAGCQAPPAGQPGATTGAVGPLGQISTATSFPGLPLGRGRAPATGGPAAVVDPYAGQGVATPDIPGADKLPAAKTAPQSSTAATPASQSTHRVVAGETGWSIARKYNVSVADLAAANGMDAAMPIRTGQVLKIPGAAQSSTNTVSAPGQGTPTPPPPSAAKPLPDEKTKPAASPAPKGEAPDLGATRTAASGSGKLRMPVAGAITRAYAKGSNDGIDISAASGTSVVAAGAGTVAAITKDASGVPIVVVRHEGDLLTVYAGLGALSVQKGQQVSAGDKIGSAGSGGSVHFEVRQGFDSVNPENYL